MKVRSLPAVAGRTEDRPQGIPPLWAVGLGYRQARPEFRLALPGCDQRIGLVRPRCGLTVVGTPPGRPREGGGS